MSQIADLTAEQVQAEEAMVAREYDLIAANKMALDLSRGKPAADQLDLSEGLEDMIQGNYIASDGSDARNYGGLRGIPEARELGATLLGIPSSAVLAGGNSSLFLMHLVVNTALHHGLWQDHRRWSNASKAKVLTPVPGYDRHFSLSEALGIEMIPVEMTASGPDMQQAAALVAKDADIKGIWCVPKYSNPTGCTYSDDTVAAMAALPGQALADDFVVLWDNAYAVHDLELPGDELASIFDAANKVGTSDHVVQFASTSKITFAGAGVAFIGASDVVLQALEEQLGIMMIGADKVNQLRHCRFLENRLPALMLAHADLLRPKFDIVLKTLSAELPGWGATWTTPRGGYFVSLDLPAGVATKVVSLAKAVGLTLTPAGATYPYGKDPLDRNVRIAPTFATLDQLKVAMQTLIVCVKLAILQNRINSTAS